MSEDSQVKYYPLFIDLKGKKVVVVGGGRVAERKVRDLVATGADVSLVSPDLTPGLKELVDAGVVQHLMEPFSPEHLQGAWLIIAATNDPNAQRRIFDEATARRIFCNVVDQPELCSFIVPASVRRGDLCISISTSGSSPALARKIRKELERVFGPVYATYVSMIGKLRQVIMDQIPPGEERKDLLQRLADDRIIAWMEQGRIQEIEVWAESIGGSRAAEVVRNELSEKALEGLEHG